MKKIFSNCFSMLKMSPDPYSCEYTLSGLVEERYLTQQDIDDLLGLGVQKDAIIQTLMQILLAD